MPRVMRIGEEAEHDDDQQVDGQGNHGAHRGGGDDDVVGEMNLAKQITAVHNRGHAHGCGFIEEAPQAGTA